VDVGARGTEAIDLVDVLAAGWRGEPADAPIMLRLNPCLRRGCGAEEALSRCEPARTTHRKTPPSSQSTLSTSVSDMNQKCL